MKNNEVTKILDIQQSQNFTTLNAHNLCVTDQNQVGATYKKVPGSD